MTSIETLYSRLRSFARGASRSIRRLGNGELDLARQKLFEKNERLRRCREQLEKKDREIARLRMATQVKDVVAGRATFNQEKIIWIFCTGRSGSTWLGSMMGDLEGHDMWNEPLVGQLFGEFYYVHAAHRRGNKFILGPSYKEVWLRSIESLVLASSAARYSELSDKGCLVIKEPHGSVGAPLLVEALPESRMVFLIRDPRDAVASALDAHRKGSWTSQHGAWKRDERSKLADADPDKFVEDRSRTYLQDIEKSWQAYEAHKGPKTLVRYEYLVADTLGEMCRIYRELGIEVEEGELARVIEKHSWSNIPEEKKGHGKFYRKASPGGWREDLTPEQVRMVEEITASVAGELYFR